MQLFGLKYSLVVCRVPLETPRMAREGKSYASLAMSAPQELGRARKVEIEHDECGHVSCIYPVVRCSFNVEGTYRRTDGIPKNSINYWAHAHSYQVTHSVR